MAGERGGEARTAEDPGAAAVTGVAGTWLLLVPGGQAACRYALYRLGRAGAIRHDFATELVLSELPVGAGSQAEAFRVYPRTLSAFEHKALVAKVPLPKSGPAGAECPLPPYMRQEVEMLTAAGQHPHIVEFFGLFCSGSGGAAPGGPREGSRTWATVLELCCGGDLFECVRPGPLAEQEAQAILRGLLSALVHIHDLGIMHRDVKPENVLLSIQRRPVLADFGIACRVSDKREAARRCGSPGYVAPEVLQGKAYSVKVDCFSAGTVLFFLLHGASPFVGPSTRSTLKRTVRCHVDFSGLPSTAMSGLCKDLMLLLMTKDGHDRISAAEAAEHAWFHMGPGCGDEQDAAEGAVRPVTQPLPSVSAAPPKRIDALTCQSEPVIGARSPRVGRSPRVTRSSRSSSSTGRSLLSIPEDVPSLLSLVSETKSQVGRAPSLHGFKRQDSSQAPSGSAEQHRNLEHERIAREDGQPIVEQGLNGNTPDSNPSGHNLHKSGAGTLRAFSALTPRQDGHHSHPTTGSRARRISRWGRISQLAASFGFRRRQPEHQLTSSQYEAWASPVPASPA